MGALETEYYMQDQRIGEGAYQTGEASDREQRSEGQRVLRALRVTKLISIG